MEDRGEPISAAARTFVLSGEKQLNVGHFLSEKWSFFAFVLHYSIGKGQTGWFCIGVCRVVEMVVFAINAAIIFAVLAYSVVFYGLDL